MICCHVDDFCWGGNQLFKVEVIDLIKTKFPISKEDISMSKYLGLKCTSLIIVHQPDYTNGIEN